MFGLLLPKGVFRYSVMPEIGTRFHALFMGGFHYVPYFIAVVYQMVGLLPRSHPYLKQSNMGLYGIRHVVSEAANNITFSIRNIDQIIMFFAVMVGLVIFLIQILSLGAMVFLQPALAGPLPIPTNWSEFFTVSGSAPDYRSHDLAYMMLDMVFGVPHPGIANTGFFESCVGKNVVCMDNFANIPDTDLTAVSLTGIAGQMGPLTSTAYTYFPFPYHLGIHRLFQIYSNGLLVVAVMITSYFIVTILAETAQSGTPFGKRFNKTWAPLRIVVAFGLLMPLTTGLNSSQYVVLYAAKFGSAFASNGWRMFNSSLTTTLLGDATTLVAKPNTPEMGYLTEFLYVAKVCRTVYEHNRLLEMKEEARKAGAAIPTSLGFSENVQMYVLTGAHSSLGNTWPVNSGDSYNDLVGTTPGAGYLEDGKKSVLIRFGVRNNRFTDELNFVSPVCGEINLALTDPGAVPTGTPTPGYAEYGPYLMQFQYFLIIQDIWHDAGTYTNVGGNGAAYAATQTAVSNHRHQEVARRLTNKMPNDPAHPIKLDSGFVNNVNNNVKTILDGFISSASSMPGTAQRITDNLSSTALNAKGWAGAGIWYNRIAEMNGGVISSVYAKPDVTKYPAIMEQVASIKTKYNKEIDEKNKHNPDVVGIGGISQLVDGDTAIEFATTLYKAKFAWETGGTTKETLKGNAVLDAISAILGLNGLYDLRDNPNTHPLAMLVGVGRSLVESSIRSLGYATIGAMLSAANIGGSFGEISASFFVSIAMIGLTVGFVLFYVVPFLPFIYFFFAVGGWIKGIFEAMVGAPLWALAHIRIDGHGLPGSAAINGYFLIFEVFLRPILIIFGLLASISVFSALVAVLNDVFQIVANNIGGYDMETELSLPAAQSKIGYMRSRIDEFFFTVIYAILVYLIGMSSFKMIDTIPNNILRWMGQSVATFGDQREDPAQGLVSKTSIGSQQALGKIGGGMQSIVKGAASAGK